MLRFQRRYGFRSHLPIVFVAVAALVAGGSRASGETSEPWLVGAFAAEPAAVAEAAAGLSKADHGAAVMLWRDEHFTFDAEGRMTHRRRWVYRILTPAGLEGWSLSEAAWSPWHQARPEVRARVISPSGDERWLDPARFVELLPAETGLGGDRRLLRAPLPITVGAVVEEEVVLRDERPYFAAGVSAKHLLLMPVPIVRGRLTIEVPAALPLRYAVRGLTEIVPRRSKKSGVLSLRFDYADMPAAQPVEEALPPETTRYPHVAFSTGQNWAAVADAYGRAVDEAIAESEAAVVLGWLPDKGAITQIDRTDELLQGVRESLRYEAVDLGTAGVIPAPPLETIRRGAGDGKDMATVLAAALRAAGIPAYVALVRAGYGKDLDPGLPGLGRFNQALVYVPAGEPLWLDPGDPWSRAGELASDLQGRLALVASPNTRRLTRTRVPTSRDNLTHTTVEIFLAEEGPARLIEESIYYGSAERRQRLVTAQVDPKERQLGYEAYVKAAYKAEALGEVQETDVDDLSEPYRLRLEVLRAHRGWTSRDRSAVAIDFSYLLTALPREFLIASATPRKEGFVFHEPFITEWRYRIRPPKGMTPGVLPVDTWVALSTGRFSRTVRRKGAEIQATLRLDSGPRRLSPAQFEAFRTAVQELLLQEPLVLEFLR